MGVMGAYKDNNSYWVLCWQLQRMRLERWCEWERLVPNRQSGVHAAQLGVAFAQAAGSYL